MPALGAGRSPRRILPAPRLRPGRIGARRLRRVARVAGEPPLKLRDPLVLRRDALLQPLDLLVHAQQHRDDDVLALPVDRFRLGALHTPGFDAARLCPPDPLNAYHFLLAEHALTRPRIGQLSHSLSSMSFSTAG